jgi:hypothetical protein
MQQEQWFDLASVINREAFAAIVTEVSFQAVS